MHSKGPWGVEKQNKDSFYVCNVVGHRDDGSPVYGGVLADVYATMDDGATFDGNAALIAAAPDLLDACRELVAWAETCSTAADRTPGKWPMFDRARSAIEKANAGHQISSEAR